MPQTMRVYWGRLRGRTPLNFDGEIIDRTSTVIITASEWRLNPINQEADDGDYQRFVGDATIRVANISPHGPPTDPNRGVTFVVEVDYDEALPVVTDITVMDGRPGQIVHTENASDA